RVRIAACDVADRAAVAALVASEPRWAAVFHLAGVLDDGLVIAQTPERLAAVMAPKVLGAQHLDELLADQPLEAFVLFSSLAGVLGGAGQCAYAAANAFLDALVADRRRRGLPGASLAW